MPIKYILKIDSIKRPVFSSKQADIFSNLCIRKLQISIASAIELVNDRCLHMGRIVFIDLN